MVETIILFLMKVETIIVDTNKHWNNIFTKKNQLYLIDNHKTK